MLEALKSFSNRTTMYRLVLYYLLVLFIAAFLFGMFGILPYAPLSLLYSGAILVAAAWIANELLAWLFGATTNHESAIITGLILALIFQPVVAEDAGGAVLLSLLAVVAMSSKYVFSIGKKHLFNPVAFAAVYGTYVLGVSATWWVSGSTALLPLVLVGGLLIVYKLRRFDLVLSFFVVALATVAATSYSPAASLSAVLSHSALFFLALAMLTEPLTMPPTRALRILYGGIVGFLFAPAIHVAQLFFSPELALLAGNLFSYLASPKGRFMLALRERRKLAEGIYEFVFESDRPLRFSPGQYLEWTLPKVGFDSRGNRRYFTIASSPGAPVALGVRFYEAPSAFKHALAALPAGGTISAGSLGGDFTLPNDTKKKLAFIAGGVGVTPFASMARHMASANEPRDAVLLYSSKRASEVAYGDVFAETARFGLRSVYVVTDEEAHATRRGPIDAALIAREIPDFRERLFYVSGPPGMVDAMKRALRSLGVSRFSIKTDYFPGLA